MKKLILISGILFTLVFNAAHAQTTGSAAANNGSVKNKYTANNPGKASPTIKAPVAKKAPKRAHISVPPVKQGLAVKK